MNIVASLLALSISQAAPAPDTPVGEAAKDCRASFPLSKPNVRLSKELKSRLTAAGYGALIRKRRLAVAIVDLTPKTRIHYAGVNDDEMMYAASLPKIVALLGVAQGAKEGRIRWTPGIAKRLDRMINDSSNPDAAWAVNTATLDYLEEVVRREGYCFYGDRHGGLWVGRPYGKGGESNREPLENLSHAATARQVARFYTLLDKGLLVGPVGTKRIRAAMGPPRKHHKFVGALKDREDVQFLARKSGTWRQFHSDSALVVHGDTRYVVVGIAEGARGKKAMTAIAQIADDLVMLGAHRAQ